MEKKWNVGIVGATGMVGQRLITLLNDHPYFQITALMASARSAGRSYEKSVEGRWKMQTPLPQNVAQMPVYDAQDLASWSDQVDFVFCAVNMPKDQTRQMEEQYAKNEIPVVSCNSAFRRTPDVPMVIPEINSDHFAVIETQRKRLGTRRGFIAVKPNCSIQAYVPMLSALLEYEPYEVVVTTYQAISGAGKTFAEWPEMVDNIIPFISGEEEKSEMEPLHIWGSLKNGVVTAKEGITITTQCVRVPVTDGHTACVFVKFRNKPTKEQILTAWKNYRGLPQELQLPSAPEQFITYFEEDNRPQAKLDRDLYGGMGVSAGRLREDTLYDYIFIGLAHNTLRGAGGGAVLEAECLAKLGYFDA